VFIAPVSGEWRSIPQVGDGENEAIDGACDCAGDDVKFWIVVYHGGEG
jgi:hypothetical protein